MTRDEPSNPADRVIGEVLDAEGTTRAPDRLLEDVFARTARARQARRRPWDGVRLPTVPGSPLPLVVAAVVVVASLAALVGTGGSRPPAPSLVLASPSASAVPGPSPAIACGSAIGLSRAGAASLWVGCPTGIRLVDVSSATPVVGPLIEGVGVPVSGGAGTWAITLGGLVEMNPVTGRGRTLGSSGVAVLAVGDTVLWGGTTDGRVLRIDPASGDVTGTIDLGARPLSMVEAGGRLWVAADDLAVHAYDTATLDAGAVVPVGSDAARIATDGAAVYVVSQGVEGTVTRVDLGTGAVSRIVAADPTDPRSLGELLATDRGVWVTRRSGLLPLDFSTGQVGAEKQLGGYPTGLVADGGSAWTIDTNGVLVRVALP